MRVHLLLVVCEGLALGGCKKLKLSDANAVLARNDAAEVFGNVHNTCNNRMGLLQHVVVIGIHGQVGVHIAIARMHVKGHKDTRSKHAHMAGLKPLDDIAKGKSREKPAEFIPQFALPRDPKRAILKAV